MLLDPLVNQIKNNAPLFGGRVYLVQSLHEYQDLKNLPACYIAPQEELDADLDRNVEEKTTIGAVNQIIRVVVSIRTVAKNDVSPSSEPFHEARKELFTAVLGNFKPEAGWDAFKYVQGELEDAVNGVWVWRDEFRTQYGFFST